MEQVLERKNIFEYNFLELFSAIVILNDKNPMIVNSELEEKLYKYYEMLDFKLLFKNIYPKEKNKKSIIDLSTSFVTAYNLGIMTPIRDSNGTKSLIIINEKNASEIIAKYDYRYVELMRQLVLQLYDELEQECDNSLSDVITNKKMI